MTNEELLRRTAARLGIPVAEVRRFQAAYLAEISAALKRGERVYLTRFGSLVARRRRAMVKRHPRTGRMIFTLPDVRVKLQVFSALRRYLRDEGDE